MQRPCFFLFVATLTLNAASPFTGRWDITVTTATEKYPGWFDLIEKDGVAQVRVQPRTGSVHPASNVKAEGSHLIFTLSPANAKAPEMTWDLTVAGDQVKGRQKRGDVSATLAGVRAPALKRPMPKAWSNPEPLFDGKDLKGWEPFDVATNHWVAQDGILLNTDHGSNLRTTRKFEDFKLHVELNCPDGGNSGVYLRGRYEMQVAYEKEPDLFHSMGAIYGFLAPSVEMPRKPGQWEAFDITLVGRWLTIVRDGKTLIDNQEIPGITGGALDSNESDPGVFYIQGDHTGGMKYRNLTVSVPK
jgi:hypothetical protein